MKPLALFFKLLLFILLLVPLLALHGVEKNSAFFTKKTETTGVGLAGNLLQNNTLYFRHFEFSDYFSAHQFFPSSPILERESFIYRVKNR